MANYIKSTAIQENSISETKLDSSLQSWKETVTNHINNNDNPHNITKSSIGLDNVTNDAQVKRSELGVANGVATLDSTGKVPSGQLPSYVDDVIEGYLYNGVFYKDTSYTTSIVGESGKIYIDLPTNKTYRWTGSVFGVISETIALGELSSTAYRGDRGKIAYDHSQSAHAPSNAQANVIETIKVNGTALTPNSKAVDITIPTVGNGTITIKQGGTSKGTFTTNQNGNTTIELTDTNTTYTAGDGLSLSGTTFSNKGVRSIATGTTNGTISVNTNGNISNIEVYGLKSAAYTNSSAYAAASHTHSYLPLSGGMITGTLATPLNIKTSVTTEVGLRFYMSDSPKLWVGYTPDVGAYLYAYSNHKLGLSDAGVGFLDSNTLIHSGNYNSYAPKLDGTGASGTWGINISGNAATATNADTLDGYHASAFSKTVRISLAIGQVLRINMSLHTRGLLINAQSINTGRNALYFVAGYGNGTIIRNDIRVIKGGPYDLYFNGTSEEGCVYIVGTSTAGYSIDEIYINPFDSNDIVYSIVSSVPSDAVLVSSSNSNILATLNSNVASATKLATSRTIWGQSFDGTGNVDGHIISTLTDLRLYYNTNKLFLQAAPTGIFLGEGTADTTYLSLYGKYIRLYIGSSEKMRIADSGNVGIGTTSPSAKLHVEGNVVIGGTITADKKDTLLSLYSLTEAGILFQSDGSGGDVAAIYEHKGVGNGLTFAEMDRDFIWRTGASAYKGGGEGIERMRLTNGGNVGIGTASPACKLDVAGDIRASKTLSSSSIELNGALPFIDFHYDGDTADYTSRIIEGVSGELTLIGKLRIGSNFTSPNVYTFHVASGDSFFDDNVITGSDFSSRGNAIIDGTVSCTQLLQTSDIKYKTNIKQIEYEEALKIIENLNPVTWDWNENTKISGSSSGFIAQEVKDIIPNAVSEDDENTLSLDYTQLHSYEIKVIQEQQKEIKDLKQRLEVLENLVSQLTNREI